MKSIFVFNRTMKSQFPLAVLVGMFSSGCATRPNGNIEQTREDLVMLKSDPGVAENAAMELQDAEQAVARAKETWARTKDREEAEHLAYLAARRIEIARVKTNQRIAEREAIRLSQARDTASSMANRQAGRRGEARAAYATARAERFGAILENRELKIEELRRSLSELQARESARGLTLTLGDVLFETNQAELRPGAERKLAPLVAFLRDHPKEVVVIEGHTDNTGTAASNTELSGRRADAARRIFLAEGITTDRIVTRGFGEQYPIASNDSEAGRLQNRRVEIVISNRVQNITQSRK